MSLSVLPTMSLGLASGGVQGEAAFLAAQLADSPVARWRLNETGTPATSVDDIGGIVGTNVGTVVSASGPWAGSFSRLFDGSSQYIDAGDVLDIGLDDMTFEMWVKDSNVSGSRFPFSKSIAASGGGRYSGRIEDGKPGAFVVLSNNAKNATGTTPMSGWWHFVVVYDRSGNISIYANGQIVAAISISAYSAEDLQTVYPFWIAAYPATPNNSGNVWSYFQGRLSNLAAYRSALSPARIAAHYAAAGI